MRNNIALLTLLSAALCTDYVCAGEFENAQTAVSNMRIGWNLGNTLDANSGDCNNMWIERWTNRTPSAYETSWGQPVAIRETIHMFKEAGFNTIRIPVTWYPHVGNTLDLCKDTGKWDMSQWVGYEVDPVWMARVKEVVNYVIDEGMYCIINVHHDTGEASTAWLKAEMDSYNKNKERFESLWTQIATEFRDYDEHLLFAGYNEILDKYVSWCFASYKAPGRYNEADARDAYQAVNSFAQSFVNAVRATGGNNAERNLIINTYGSCSGAGTWNQHLDEPLTCLERPHDTADDHIIFELHTYFDHRNLDNVKQEVDEVINDVQTYLLPKGAPAIIGEWGSNSDINANRQNLCDYARYYVEKCKEAGIANCYWMVLSDGADRNVPKFTAPDLVVAIVKGYYGEGGYSSIAEPVAENDTDPSIYNLMGVQVSGDLPAGIYIRAGRKFIVR